ncbi:MAG: hypothetical protein IPK07_24380 [Deltaproteobacteria bacterium]|jgi:hypothetical protein|nr:hypothetical protein [Deltaproteobacteria bacterium]
MTRGSRSAAFVPRVFASAVFAGIAVFLVARTWLPARASLRQADGVIVSIRALRNAWSEVEISTTDGASIRCKGRRGWPAAGASRCPIEAFERASGQRVSVTHDGRRPYEVRAGDAVILAYSAHRRAQTVGLALAGMMLVGSALVWMRK